MALVVAFAVSPYSHVHQWMDADEHHSAPRALRHAHLSDHPHDEESSDHEEHGEGRTDEEVWRVDDFVFQQASTLRPPPPSLIELPGTYTPVLRSWRVAAPFHPVAHGPPPVLPSSPRAPPVSLPSFL